MSGFTGGVIGDTNPRIQMVGSGAKLQSADAMAQDASDTGQNMAQGLNSAVQLAENLTENKRLHTGIVDNTV